MEFDLEEPLKIQMKLENWGAILISFFFFLFLDHTFFVFLFYY
jgi:hypothetical protein